MTDIYITAPDFVTFKNTDSWWVNIQCQNGQTQPTFQYPGTGTLYIDSYVNCKKDVNTSGAFMSNSPSGGTGGGAVQLGYGFTDVTDMPMITLPYAPASRGSKNTLWLKQGTDDPNKTKSWQWDWAHLELGNLIANGSVTFNEWLISTAAAFHLKNTSDWITAYVHGNLYPNWDGQCYLGANWIAWGGVYTYHLYQKVGGGITTWFDSIDDLAAVKACKPKTFTSKDGKQWQEADLDSLPFLKSEDKAEDCWDGAKVQGFLLGCSKASALKFDQHESNIADLLKRVEALESQVKLSTATA